MNYELPSWALVGIRTGVQAAIGTAVAWLTARNIEIGDATVIEDALTVIIIGLTASILRWGERRWPWLSRILSLFLTSTKPVYIEQSDVAMVADAVSGMTTAKAE